MDFETLMETSKKNLEKADQDQIFYTTALIKKNANEGVTSLSYNPYGEKKLRSATKKFFEKEGFEVTNPYPNVYNISWKKELDTCGALYREVLNSVIVAQRNRLISFIKESTARGLDTMVYAGVIDDFSLNQLQKQGFIVESEFSGEGRYNISINYLD